MRSLLALLVPVLLLSASCGADDHARTDAAAVPDSTAFAESFTLARTVVLQQPDTAPIARLSGIDHAEDGHLVIGDVSEGNVKLFAPDGRLVAIIGRKGEGPGEFSAPRFPRFGPDGSIHVADAQNPRIQVFDRSGRLLRGTRLDGFSGLAGFQPLPNGTYLLAVHRESDPRVLAEVDTAGKVIRELLPIGAVRPEGEPRHALWQNVGGVFLDVSGDTAYVAHTLADSLWTVHLPSGTIRSTHLALPASYVRPRVPRELPGDIPGLMAWSSSFHQASVVTAARGTLVLPFVRGILNNGDPLLLVVRDAGGRWRVAHDAPPVIGGGAEQVIAILDPDEEQVRLGFFSPVTRR